jgi:hypothetical protein
MQEKVVTYIFAKMKFYWHDKIGLLAKIRES